MGSTVPYDTLRAYKVNHKLILKLAESLNDEQMRWKPAWSQKFSRNFPTWALTSAIRAKYGSRNRWPKNGGCLPYSTREGPD
jgi:hypothetical protein